MNAIATRHEGETSVYQLFFNEQPQRVERDNPERIAHLNEKKALASSLGLVAQISLIEREIRREKSPVLDTPPMTSDELIIWKAFLPTAYHYYPHGGYGGDTQRYNYDAIPYPVLAKWKECKDEGVFDKYEIWTPEVKNIDPALVGCVGEHYYMLARWAESDANFVTLGTIKRKLVWRWLDSDGAIFGAFIIGMIALVITFFGGLLIHEKGTGAMQLLWAMAIAGQYVFGTGALLWLFICGMSARSTPMIRAIIRHTMKKGT